MWVLSVFQFLKKVQRSRGPSKTGSDENAQLKPLKATQPCPSLQAPAACPVAGLTLEALPGLAGWVSQCLCQAGACCFNQQDIQRKKTDGLRLGNPENWLTLPLHSVTDVLLAFFSEVQEGCPTEALLTPSKKERDSHLPFHCGKSQAMGEWRPCCPVGHDQGGFTRMLGGLSFRAFHCQAPSRAQGRGRGSLGHSFL